MENGVERVVVEEKSNVGNEGFGVKVEEERVVVGSDESKDLEDEVFEEAIESHEHLQEEEEEEEGMKVESVGFVESIGESSPAFDDENSNLGNETEKFKEVIFVPAESGNPEELGGVVGEEKVEDLVGGDSVDKIDEGGTAKEAGSNESSGGEVAEIIDNGGTEVLKAEGEGEVDSKQETELSEEILPKDDEKKVKVEDELDIEYQATSDNSVKISEDKGEGTGQNLIKMDSEHLDDKSGSLKDDGESAEEVGNDELNGCEKVSEIAVNGETQALRSEDEANFNRGIELSNELKSDGESAQEAGNNEMSGGEEVSEIAGNGGTEALKGEDESHFNQEIELNMEILPEDGKREELKEDKLGAEYQEANDLFNGSGDLQDDKSEGLDENLERKDIKHEVEKNGNFESAIVGLDSGNEVNKSEQFRDISAGVNKENQHGSNGNLKDVSAVIDLDQNGKTSELKAASAIPLTVEEEKLAPEVFASSSSENSVMERNEEIQAHASTLRSEDNKGSELHHADNNINRASKNTTVTESPQKTAEKGQEDKKNAPASIERKIQHLPEIASSSAKSLSAAPSPSRPAGLGRAAPLLEPAPRATPQLRANGTVSHTQSQQIEDPTNGESEEFDETREKLQMIRVKFLRLAHRLGQTPHNVVVAQVLYRLGLAEQLRGRNGGRVAGFDRASAMAEHLEAAGQEPLDFSCTIMVLGKTGVGKSATINSIFDEVKFGTDAFQLGTKKVQDVVGTVQGIKVRVIDTPGLLPSWSDQRQNEKILHSVKSFIKKTPPDIVLYLDRLDMQSRDFGDMPLLRTITDIFGPSIWFNAIVVLTHAASAPPDGPNGTASSYDMFVTQRSHAVQQAIRLAAGDMRLMNPVSLVENHSACRTNRAGQRVLPNGQVWKPHLLLLSFASKILAEANALLKLQDSTPAKPFATRARAPPLPFLLSSLLQSRPQVKLPEEQYGDEDGLDDDLDESSDSEDESEYDGLPPFKSLTRAQIAKLTKVQKKAYFDELEYREKLFMKKQLKEEKRRRKLMEKMAAAAKDLPSEYAENAEEEGGAASVPVPMPDLALPASFDSDNPTHRYRYLDTSNQWLVRPVLETHGWDHDVGYEGINVERLFVVKDKIPISFSGQVTKDKKDANVQMELASSLKYGEGKATSLGFDMQTVGKDMAYTLRSETRFSNFRKNKATAGLSVTLLGDVLSAGVKVEDKLIAGKRFQMVMSGGAMAGRGDVAYGGSLEVQLRDKDYPLGRSLSTLGLSVMDWHGDLAIGCNVQSQIPIGRSTNLIGRANLNNRGAGQISIRVNSSEQLQLALISLFPLLKKLIDYSQQMQFGQ
ncbi:translocase of chloroplast 120 [Populus alba x Populus x berolinensis]|uniref:Translocase of chloroplast 120 n=1 Tax=Populus alba x Populus x berolinensis TaxID=444605 RepID=A0AAD6W6S8_9ROSI|nr:translocase of chloroplast 120 [Populus alba x Populus x berolinensis]